MLYIHVSALVIKPSYIKRKMIIITIKYTRGFCNDVRGNDIVYHYIQVFSVSLYPGI